MNDPASIRRIRLALALVALLALASMAFALYLQFVEQLEPCPLCSIQRVALIACGLLAAAGALALRRRGSLLAITGLSAVAGLAGAGVAGWHSWLLAFPPESLSCGRPFQWFHDEFPLAVWLPKLFRGDGDCLAVDWSLLGLTIPHWSLLVFIAVLALLAFGIRGARRAGA